MSRDILVVEDDRSLARSLARVLETAGYATRQVHDGEAALREVARAEPDLILLDLLLPRKDGHAVLSVLKQSRATQEIPVIATSGVFRGSTHQSDLRSAGACAFLEKPFSADDLLATIGRQFGAARALPPQPGVQVELSDTSAIEFLGRAMRERISGAVHFKHEGRHKIVLLQDGAPRSIRSNLARESLGQRLLDAGHIDEAAHRESVARARNSDIQQGEILLRMGLLTSECLAQALQTQAAEKLLELFGWNEGQAWIQPGVSEVPLASGLDGWTPGSTILQGVERVPRNRIESRLAPYMQAGLRWPAGSIDPARLGEAVCGLRAQEPHGMRVSDLFEEYGALLYGLWILGVIEFDEKESGVKEDAPEAVEEARRLRELRRLYETQASQNHFEVLGVAADSSSVQIRKAFMQFARRFHPDRFRQASPETARLAARLFARISEANDVLTDPAARQTYCQTLHSRGPSDERAELARIVSAEREFHRGEEHLRRQDPSNASGCFERALELAPEEGDFHSLAGWTRFLLERADPEAKLQAIAQLRKGIELAPRSAAGYYYLGRLHKACEEMGEAHRMFQKTLEVFPGHVEATRELRLFEMRQKNRSGRGPGGLLGLGRKKT